MTLKQVIEALVFASPKPITTKEIVAALRAAGEGSEDQEAKDFFHVRSFAMVRVAHPEGGSSSSVLTELLLDPRF